MEALDEIEPYRVARQQYAGDLEMLDAHEMGTKAINRTMDEVVAEMNELGDAAADMYRTGFAAQLLNVIERPNRPTTALANLRNPAMQRKIAAVFPEGDIGGFVGDVQRLANQQTTYNAALSGSRTAPLQADVGEFNDPGLMEAIRSQRGLADMGREFVGGMAGRTQAPTSDIASALSQRLFMDDPSRYLIGLQNSAPAMARDAANRTNRGTLGAFLTSQAATELGANRGLLDRRRYRR